MNVNREKACASVRRFLYPDENMAVGWEEFSEVLQISVKACQIDLANDPFWLIQNDEDLRLVMVAEPPDEFAVLRTTPREIINARDNAEPQDICVITVSEYAQLRRKGPIYWERFVDLKIRFPDLDGVLDGQLGRDHPTRAKFFPVCIDRSWLRTRATIRSYARLAKRRNAARKARGVNPLSLQDDHLDSASPLLRSYFHNTKVGDSDGHRKD